MKQKNKPAKRLNKLKSTDSTTTEEISMSVHSDSDLYDVYLEQIENLNDMDLEQTDLDIFDLEDDELVKRNNDEKEAEIFNDFGESGRREEGWGWPAHSWVEQTQNDTDNKTEIKTSLNECGYSEILLRIEVTDEDKTEEELQIEEECK
ncbi:unnamed protein product [Parnassius mnemosyne]|uniref:Uncharacterized protein n=1 Tax=Parnassius mnemosyne TaxID=213953 RepID=A0AAV1KMF4_9NEOP